MTPDEHAVLVSTTEQLLLFCAVMSQIIFVEDDEVFNKKLTALVDRQALFPCIDTWENLLDEKIPTPSRKDFLAMMAEAMDNSPDEKCLAPNRLLQRLNALRRTLNIEIDLTEKRPCNWLKIPELDDVPCGMSHVIFCTYGQEPTDVFMNDYVPRIRRWLKGEE